MAPFPSDFTWGVSTAAYQIEGAVGDGKGPSIWDVFAHTPGRIRDGSSADVACDHLARLDEDLDLLAELGVGAYRFSTAWTRIFPDGGGRPRRQGLDVYERLVDGLLARGIAPWLCVYHWDLPQALQERGGWSSRDTVHYFADYVATVAERLGDRVGHFLMLNEPNVHAVLGHLLGVHAPGLSDPAAFAAAVHHQNLATGVGIQRLREMGGPWTLGTVVNLQPVVPAAEGEEHRRAAELVDAVWNRCTLDPLLLGRYPEQAVPLLGGFAHDDDLALIWQPLDVLGVNYYTRTWVRASEASLVGLEQADPPAGSETTAMGWEVVPQALTAQLEELKERYGNPPVVVTENGAAYDDGPVAGDRLEDPARARYLVRHLEALRRALEAGCDVRGYFVWTLVDNFEWAEGFSKRFGLVHLDRATQRRTPKRSFDVYRDIVGGGTLELEDDGPIPS
ncbi:MAG: GH1 family beta-glucosidase [Deinococcales bacterium]